MTWRTKTFTRPYGNLRTCYFDWFKQQKIMENKFGITTQMVQTLFVNEGLPVTTITLTKYQMEEIVEVSIELLGEEQPIKFGFWFASLVQFIESTQKIHIGN